MKYTFTFDRSEFADTFMATSPGDDMVRAFNPATLRRWLFRAINNEVKVWDSNGKPGAVGRTVKIIVEIEEC